MTVVIYIFKDPGFLDDSLSKDWVVQRGAQSQDGDILEVTAEAADWGESKKTGLNIDGSVYQKFQVRVKEILGGAQWRVELHHAGGSVTIFDSQTGTGLFEATVPVYTYTGISLITKSTGTDKKVKFDLAAFGKLSSVQPPASDIIGQLVIEKPSKKGLGGCTLTLNNETNSYEDLALDDFVVVIVDDNKLFGGRIANNALKWTNDKRERVALKCVDHGFELATLPYVRKIYSQQNLKQIIQDLLTDAVVVTDYGVDPDSELTTLHDFTFDNITVQEAIEKACETEAVEWFVDPAGNLWVFPENKYSSSLTVDESTTYELERAIDFLSLRKKIKVLGGEGNTIPSDGDAWTENTTNWTKSVNLTLSADDTDKQVGTASIKATGSAQVSNWIMYTMTSTVSLAFADDPKTLKFWVKAEAGNGLSPVWRIRLYDDAGKAADKYFHSEPPTSWALTEVDVGPKASGWFVESGFNWEKIEKIRFFFYANFDGITFWVDGLCFAKKPFEGSAEDTGLGPFDNHNLLETDSTLQSDSDAQNLATQIRDQRKNGVQQFTCTVQGGDYKPGYKQTVSYPTVGLSGDYRIARVTHNVKYNDWKAKLDLNLISPAKLTELLGKGFKASKRIQQEVREKL